jgi:uncharacterized protein (TIGR00251 family)
MIIEVHVVPKSGRFSIEKNGDRIKVYLRSPPEGNRANFELVREFERIFGKPVKIIFGAKSKKKRIELPVSEAEWNKFLSEL